MATTLKLFKLTALPTGSALEANALYYINNGGLYAEAFATTASKVVKPMGNSAMIQALINNTDFSDKAVELRNNGTYLQWKNIGASSSAWANLISLDELRGAPGGASEAVNIKDYGITSSDADQTTAFLAAMTATNNKEVLFENMTLRIKPVQIGGSNRKLVFRNTVVKYADPGGAQPDRFLYFASVNGLEISGLVVDMEHLAGDPNFGTNAVYFDSCNFLKFHDNYVFNNGHAAIRILGGNHVTVRDNLIENTDSAIFVNASPFGSAGNQATKDLKIINNTIDGGTSEGIGIFSHASDLTENWVVAENTIINKTTSYAFNFAMTKNGLCVNNNVRNCLGGAFLMDNLPGGSGFAYNEYSTDIDIRNNRFIDIYTGISNAANGCSITDNTFKNVGRSAIYTNGYIDSGGNYNNVRTRGLKISDNTFDNCSYNDQAFPIMDLQNLDESIISNNTVINSPSNNVKAIRFHGLGNNVVIKDNYAPGAKLLQSYGLEGNYDKTVSFIGNTFFGTENINIPNGTTTVKWEFIDNKYIDLDFSSFFQDVTATSNVLNKIHTDFIRNKYRVSVNTTVNTIPPSWFGREITFISKGNFTLNNGGNIVLQAAIRVLAADESISLWYDGVKWRERFISVIAP